MRSVFKIITRQETHLQQTDEQIFVDELVVNKGTVRKLFKIFIHVCLIIIKNLIIALVTVDYFLKLLHYFCFHSPYDPHHATHTNDGSSQDGSHTLQTCLMIITGKRRPHTFKYDPAQGMVLGTVHETIICTEYGSMVE